MDFSKNLKYLRSIHHVTQEELAQYLHVSRPTIAGYETKNKQPDYDKLIQISTFFNVSIDYLLKGREKAVPPSKPQKTSPVSQENQNCSKKTELLQIMDALDEQSLKDLYNYAEFLIYKAKKKRGDEI